MLTRILQVLLFIAFLSYIGVNIYFLISGLIPSYVIIIENFLYAATYLILFILSFMLNQKKLLYSLIIFVASFNAGRVSEAIIGSTGIIDLLSFSHLPVFIGLIIIIILSLLLIRKS
ncbi:MAG: hypothetical protein RXR31_00940 [Thermoproteota archaeon]|jgi:hypothetical protein